MKIKLFIICLACSVACSINLKPVNSASAPNQDPAPPAQNTQNTAANEPVKADSKELAKNTETTTKSAAQACAPVKREGKRQIKSQTFPFNFKPFPGSCFVTFGSVEDMMDEKDLPRGSTFHIYQNGNSVLDLPDAFDGQTGCWVDGVAFKDLNADGLTDIVMAGRCLGARDSYPSNAIFVNTGKGFTTNAEANLKLESFTKLSAIEAFVRKNQKLFF